MNDIKKLTAYEHVRLRTEMYFGSRVAQTQNTLIYENGKPKIIEQTWVPALYTAFREILDNSLDEVVGHKAGNTIRVEHNCTKLEFAVEDNGRGIPIDWDEEHQCHKATLALSEIMAGRNFGERGETAGVNGIGASGVNFCSKWFHLDVWRDSKHFTQKFQEGDAFTQNLQIHKPKITTSSAAKQGTRVQFALSDEVFPDRTLPTEFIQSRIYETAICNPEVKFYDNNKIVKIRSNWEKAMFDGHRSIVLELDTAGFKSKWILVPNFVEEGDFYWSLVNNIPVFNGGIHLDKFKSGFVSGLLAALERESRKRKLQPNRTDVTEKLFVYNITNIIAPNFDSQSKTRLINEEAGVAIKNWLDDPNIFKNLIKKHSWWIDEIYTRCEARTNKKDAAELAKLAKKAARAKIPELTDATGTNRQECILFLAEGRSAIGGLTAVRNPKIHGGLPLRGKVMNVYGENPKRVLENQELANIINAIGLNLLTKVNRRDLRYGKLYLAADMDHDGSNICALLVNFLYQYWPELFDPADEPFVYIFQTPFIILEKGSETRYFYSFNYHEFKSDDWQGWKVRRAKGLGTLGKHDWKHAVDNPVALPLLDDGNIKQTLDLIFNPKNADKRKEWIGL
jgi:DNA gyrase/topoisomerase IV subunit B